MYKTISYNKVLYSPLPTKYFSHSLLILIMVCVKMLHDSTVSTVVVGILIVNTLVNYNLVPVYHKQSVMMINIFMKTFSLLSLLSLSVFLELET